MARRGLPGPRAAAMRRSAAVFASALVIVLSACSDSSDAEPDAAGSVVSDEVGDEPFEPTFSTAAGESDSDDEGTGGDMRPVPTVPASTVLGQAVDDDDDGVVVVAPTLAPPAPTPTPTTVPGDAGTDGQSPDSTVAPPTTDLVGDPQPSPDSTSPPPPPTAAPPPPACERLVPFGVIETVGALVGASATASDPEPARCSISAGSATVDVEFVSAAIVRDDWFRREGIEPVVEVGGDAVGFTGSGSYTIALVGGGGGAVVTVSGSDDARSVAVEVAIAAGQAA